MTENRHAGVMRVRYALKIFFSHRGRNNNSYAAQTIIDKIMKGDIGTFNPCPTIPRGVKFTDIDVILLLQRTGRAMESLKEFQQQRPLLELIILRYGGGVKQKKLAELFKCNVRTIYNWDKAAMEFLQDRI